MHEVATLHFDLKHLSPDQEFTLRVGRKAYRLQPHTRHTLARARRTNAALAVLPHDPVTHFTGPARLLAAGPVLLRVTAPRLNPKDPLERLILTSIRLPRRARLEEIRRRRVKGAATWTKLAALGGLAMPPADDVILDLEDIGTAFSAAESLVFHHPELLALQDAPGAAVLTLIQESKGLVALAQSMLDQSQAHEADPTQKNWATSQASTDWQTGEPCTPIYVWSKRTIDSLKERLKDTLQRSKNDPDLQGQCWSVLPGITQVVSAPVNALAEAREDAEANYTVKELTPQNGVSNSFAYDPESGTATITLTNSYLRWLKVSLDQYGPKGEGIGSTTTLGELASVDTIMAEPLSPQPSPPPMLIVPELACSSNGHEETSLCLRPFTLTTIGLPVRARPTRCRRTQSGQHTGCASLRNHGEPGAAFGLNNLQLQRKAWVQQLGTRLATGGQRDTNRHRLRSRQLKRGQ